MDTLRTLLFEDPTVLLVALGVVEAGLALAYVARRTVAAKRALVGPPVLAGLVLLTAWVVQTDREKILAACEAIGERVAEGDSAALATYLDDGFVAEVAGVTLDRQASLQRIETAAGRHGVTGVRFLNPVLTIEGDRADLAVTTVVIYQQAQRALLGWDVLWGKVDGRWVILTVRGPTQGRLM